MGLFVRKGHVNLDLKVVKLTPGAKCRIISAKLPIDFLFFAKLLIIALYAWLAVSNGEARTTVVPRAQRILIKPSFSRRNVLIFFN